jgi:hypothetical protein
MSSPAGNATARFTTHHPMENRPRYQQRNVRLGDHPAEILANRRISSPTPVRLSRYPVVAPLGRAP